MQMSKEEFVAVIQRMARQEREQRELNEKEDERMVNWMLNDYFSHRWRMVKWGRDYRKKRNG